MLDVRFYEKTWLDKAFRKEVEKRPQREREALVDDITSLVRALRACEDPVQDAALARWRPSAYRGVTVPDGRVVEFRLKKLARAVGIYFAQAKVFLLVGVTVKHDHDRLIRQLESHKSALAREGHTD